MLRVRKLGLLAVLYVVEGLPYGFQALALGGWLREHGVSRTAIGLVSLVALPWSMKALWAPLVDRFGSERFGRRRSWIVPLQVLSILAMLAADAVPLEENVTSVLGLILVMNLFAATMDIAVDGLAVDVLAAEDLGAGNAIQVVGYKSGMLVGGGLLVWASARVPLLDVFRGMAAITFLALLITLATPEPRMPHIERPRDEEPRTLREVVAVLWRWRLTPGAGALLLAVFTYKMADSLMDPMVQPFLIDRGVGRDTIALWVGTIGMGTSIAGSVLGGVLATRVPIERALMLAGGLRAVPILGMFVIAAFDVPPDPWAAAVTGVEHLASGMLTTVMFALMMSRTDRTIGATHYTFLATVEVLGKSPLSLASGLVADTIEYTGTFACAALLALGWSAFAPALLRASRPTSAPAAS